MSPTIYIPLALQGLAGGAQYFSGRKMAKENERPTYEIPQSVQESVQNARVMAGGFNMPGQDLMESGLDQILANTNQDILGTATSSSDALGALIGASGKRMGAQTNLDIAAAQNYAQRNRELQGALMGLGSYEDKAWEINEMQSYQDKAASSSALTGSGMQNLFGAVNTFAGIQANKDLMKSFGQGETTTTAPKSSVQSLLNQVATMNPDSSVTMDETKLTPEAQQFFKVIGGGSKNPMMFDFNMNDTQIGAPQNTPQNMTPYNPFLFQYGKNPMNYQ